MTLIHSLVRLPVGADIFAPQLRINVVIMDNGKGGAMMMVVVVVVVVDVVCECECVSTL